MPRTRNPPMKGGSLACQAGAPGVGRMSKGWTCNCCAHRPLYRLSAALNTPDITSNATVLASNWRGERWLPRPTQSLRRAVWLAAPPGSSDCGRTRP